MMGFAALYPSYRGTAMNQKNLLEVDWSTIPPPTDDGAAAHLAGMAIPPVSLVATRLTGGIVMPSRCAAAPSSIGAGIVLQSTSSRFLWFIGVPL